MICRISCVLLLLSVSALAQSDDALFRTAAEAALKREFLDVGTSYILLDAPSGTIIASRWPNQHRAIAFGSLMKPFVAIAYGAEHQTFPQHLCHGTSDRCWLPRGHGSLALEQAIAHSCNSYFLDLATGVSPLQIEQTRRQFGLSGPGSYAPEDVIGLGNTWRNRPIDLARAYVKLLSMRNTTVPQRIFAGMTMAADDGTGVALEVADKPGRALIKTGTAKCTHGTKAPGDGFALALWPADAPRYMLLVRQHGKPGSHAAAIAGKMITLLQEGSRASAD
jgi:cell division protein FtsI/penicillin-binding protein 2